MLIQPGYFQDTYFSDYFWHGDWWVEYGVGVSCSSTCVIHGWLEDA